MINIDTERDKEKAITTYRLGRGLVKLSIAVPDSSRAGRIIGILLEEPSITHTFKDFREDQKL